MFFFFNDSVMKLSKILLKLLYCKLSVIIYFHAEISQKTVSIFEFINNFMVEKKYF